MLLANHAPEESDPEDWDTAGLALEWKRYFRQDLDEVGIDWDAINRPELAEILEEAARAHYLGRVDTFGDEQFASLEKYVMLDTVDRHWKDHLLSLDHLREGIGLRAYGQRNPLVEYKRESFTLFEAMWERIEDQVVTFLFHAEPVENLEMRRRSVPATLSHPDAGGLAASRAQQEQAANTPVQAADARPATVRRNQPKVGRNDPCPCGSGKKYKKCHGATAAAGSG
jgi:preprotein translocase subunit SecA